MKVVVVAAGDLAAGDVGELDDAELVIGADGGAASLLAAERPIHRLVGDLDSIDPALVDRLAGSGTEIERHPTDKEASDTELAVRSALAAGAAEVVLLGAVGGNRLDHELANLLLLTDPSLAGIGVRAVHGPTVVRPLRAGERLELVGRVDDLVTLLPVGGDAHGVTTGGLRWALDAATLPLGGSRGLSNEVVAEGAWVASERGTLLVVETAVEGVNSP
jgi:thiamine pyrophosphokinase